MNRSVIHPRWFLFILPFTFLLLFYFFPLYRIINLSLFADGILNIDRIATLVTTSVYLKILWFTTWQAALSTLLTLALALPGAYVFSHFRFPGKHLLEAVFTVPFVLPTVVVAAAFKALLGQNGLLNDVLTGWFGYQSSPISLDNTVTFFILAHVFYNCSLVVRLVSGFWAGIDRGLGAAARVLGAAPWQTFIKITLPLLMPAIGSASLLVFIFCFTSFGVVLILGGPGHATVEVEIYRQAVQFFNLPMAAALSLIQIAANLLLMWLYARISSRSKVSFLSDSTGSPLPLPRSLTEKIVVATTLAVMLLLLSSPLLALIGRSLSGEHGITLAYYEALFTTPPRSVFGVEPISAVLNSVGFGIAAMTISVILGILTSGYLVTVSGRGGSLWDSIFMLPLATSAVTLGFGYIITLNKPPLNLRDSLALVPIAHALVAFPFVVRCVLPSLRHIPRNLQEAATLLGASPTRVFRYIHLPMIRRAVIISAIFAFAISLGEFGASAFVTRPHTPTMPVAIFRFLGQPGEMNYGQAMAMSSILMLVTFLAFWLLSIFDKGQGTIGGNSMVTKNE